MRKSPFDAPDSEWSHKGATLSDKSAREEYGLTQEDIIRAIQADKLQYREASMHGNPWLRLLRREVEALAREKHGARGLESKRTETELARVDREIKRLKKQISALEERRSKLLSELGRKRATKSKALPPGNTSVEKSFPFPDAPEKADGEPAGAAAPDLEHLTRRLGGELAGERQQLGGLALPDAVESEDNTLTERERVLLAPDGNPALELLEERVHRRAENLPRRFVVRSGARGEIVVADLLDGELDLLRDVAHLHLVQHGIGQRFGFCDELAMTTKQEAQNLSGLPEREPAKRRSIGVGHQHRSQIIRRTSP
jgi:hypothetical protein